MAVSTKIIGGNDQPQGGEGIVSIAGARGLTAADKIGANKPTLQIRHPVLLLVRRKVDNGY